MEATEVSVDALKEQLQALIFSVSMDVIHCHVGMGEKMAIYEENGNLNDDTLRWWLYFKIVEGKRKFNLGLLQDKFTTFRARMLAFEDNNEDGTVKIREIRVPTMEVTGKIEQDLELVFQYGQNDFQPRQCCSLSVADVVEYGDELYVVAGCGFLKITQDEYDELLKMDRRDRSFSQIVRRNER